jgi:hypothetical protein
MSGVERPVDHHAIDAALHRLVHDGGEQAARAPEIDLARAHVGLQELAHRDDANFGMDMLKHSGHRVVAVVPVILEPI